MTSTNSETENKDVVETSEKNTNNSEKPSPTRSATTLDEPAFGWSAYAERVNGRFAMIGFIGILIIELLSKQTFLNWAGLFN